MGSTKEVSQFLALLALSVIIQPEECHAVSVNISAPETFIGSLFDEFGSNKSMNSQQFNSLLKELNIGSSSKEQISENGNSKVRARKLFHCFHDYYSSQYRELSFNLSLFFACFVRTNLKSGRLDFCSSLKSDLRSSLNRRLNVS